MIKKYIQEAIQRDTFNGEGGNEEMLRGMGFTEV